MQVEITARRRRVRRKAERIERICEHCGKTFVLPSWQLERSPGRWCTRRCFNRSNMTGEERQCEQCGKTFYKSAANLAYSPYRWCSTACSRIPQRRGLERECRICGKAFYVQRSHLRKSESNGFCCSDQCKGKYVGDLKRGIPLSDTARQNMSISKRRFIDTHPERFIAYRTGTGGWKKYGPNWHRQAALARERDGHICQDCGLYQMRPRLNVHHLVSRRSFGDDYISANDLANLVTLCLHCHAVRENPTPWIPIWVPVNAGA